MKLLSCAAICTALLFTVTSCQKNDSPNPPQEPHTNDTLIASVNVAISPKYGSAYSYHYDFSYDENGRLMKFVSTFGDSVSNFAYDERGRLIGFIDSVATVMGVYIGQLDTYTIQYNDNKILATDNWHIPSKKGVSTTECTLKNGLIAEVINITEYETDVRNFTYDDAGNTIKVEGGINNFVSNQTFDRNYRNPFLIKSNPIFTALYLGNNFSRDIRVAESGTSTDEMGNVTASNSKTDILEHIGSYPTKMQNVSSSGVKSDYTFTYSFPKN